MKDPRFPTEAALCDAFTAWARAGGGMRRDISEWTVYPETGGFDLLLVDKHGRQLGIEAKLSMNPKVCAQAIPDAYGYQEGPDWRGILVPSINGDLAELVKIMGLVIFTPDSYQREGRPTDFQPWLDGSNNLCTGWFDWNPVKRCRLPEMVPDVPAGVPSPVRLTQWKEGALKVLAHIEAHGSITARQVKDYGIDSRRFCASDGWLVSVGNGQWARGSVPAFDKQHPAEYAAYLQRTRDSIP